MIDLKSIKTKIIRVLELDDQIAIKSRHALNPATNYRDKAKLINDMKDQMQERSNILHTLVHDID